MQCEYLSHDLDGIIPDPDSLYEKEVYRIGDLASEFNITLRTLRFYEDRGLLFPRRSGSRRLYSAKDRARLKIILLAKRVGFLLMEIQEIMDIHDSNLPKKKRLEKILEKFRNQIDVLKIQKTELEDSMRELHNTVSTMSKMVDRK